MERRRNRFKEMERKMTWILLVDVGLFLLYLIAAGNGIVGLKVTVAIIAILISGLCLGFLYLTQEMMRTRSLWMSATAFAVLICIVFSLLLRFPSPNNYKLPETTSTVQTEDVPTT